MKWAELLNLSEQEAECIDESAEAGDGLLLAGNARVPIRGRFLRERALRPVEHQPQRNEGRDRAAQVSIAGKGR